MSAKLFVPGQHPAQGGGLPAVAVNVNGQVMNLPAVAVVALEAGLQASIVADVTSAVTASLMAEFERRGLIAHVDAPAASPGNEPTDGKRAP